MEAVLDRHIEITPDVCVGAHSIGEIIRSLILIYEVLTPEGMAGHVEYL